MSSNHSIPRSPVSPGDLAGSPLPQWIKCKSGSLVNVAQIQGIYIGFGEPHHAQLYQVVCLVGGGKIYLCDCDTEIEAEDVVERLLPYLNVSIIDIDLDILAPMESEYGRDIPGVDVPAPPPAESVDTHVLRSAGVPSDPSEVAP